MFSRLEVFRLLANKLYLVFLKSWGFNVEESWFVTTTLQLNLWNCRIASFVKISFQSAFSLVSLIIKHERSIVVESFFGGNRTISAN